MTLHLHQKHIAFIVLLLSAISVFADKKVIVRNAETGKSFELSVTNPLSYAATCRYTDSLLSIIPVCLC